MQGRQLILLLFALAISSPFIGAEPGTSHWAFQPIKRPAVPESAAADSVSWLVHRPLEQASLTPAPVATRRDWVRRLYLNLTGLPPDFDRLQELLRDEKEDAALAQQVVAELLASPRYGERWARHWLDVARYSDTKGYAYASEEFNFPHAWPYRDWVIKAFNEDMPYEQFVQRQVAADLLLEQKLCDRSDLAAMGFLTLGRRFVGVEPDIIDDRIDVATRGLLGLTVSCSRCHDHKFDPVPTADYYALYGMFKSSREELLPLDVKKARGHAELDKKKAALAAEFEKHASELESRFLARTADYLVAALDISKVPPPDFAELIEKDDLNPAQIRRWHEFLSQESRKSDPVFGAWLVLSELKAGGLAEEDVVQAVQGNCDPEVSRALSDEPLKDIEDAANRFAKLLQKAAKTDPDAEPGWRALHEVVYGPGSPIRVPRDYIHDVEWLFDETTKVGIKKKFAEIERELIKLGEAAPHSLVLMDREVPLNVRVFDRGKYPNQLEEVKRGSLSILHGGRRPAYREGSGRLEFARELTSKDNPLLARVIVNRIWRVHFGEGLVRTESDFGLRSEPPSHPGLLDFLAVELMENGWSIKHVQRLIATSSVYRERAGEPPVSDPGNRLLSVHPRRRLDFEAMRDSMLAASGELDLRMGGPPGPLFGSTSSKRRSVYGRIDRQFLPSNLRVFDFANPELHTPRRYRTNVPQQALFLMNAPFTVARSRALAARIDRELPGGDSVIKVQRLFQHVYGRNPSEGEVSRSVRFVESKAGKKPAGGTTREDPAVQAWSYGYGAFDQENGHLGAFEKLPHFDGKAWGGGASWPDGKLGWLRLTAEGGHAGNHVGHAAVRRWTAPAGVGRVKLSGVIAKIEDCGDGLRAWISSSRQGLLGAWRVEFGKDQAAEIKGIEVEPGEVLDFVLDCGETNNFSCDGFTWAPKIHAIGDGEQRVWDAARNFRGVKTIAEQMNNWERLAQVLLISNESMYMD